MVKSDRDQPSRSAPCRSCERPRADPHSASSWAKEQSLRIAAESEAKVGALEIERLKLMLAKARRAQFGQSSERGQQLIEQLELAIEDLRGGTQAVAEAKSETAAPEELPKKDVPARHVGLASCRTICRSNGSSSPRLALAANAAVLRLRRLGEVVTKTLECEPRRWKIIEHVREKFSCRDCEAITEPPAPSHPIPRGFAGPSLLAMVLVSKFLMHQPLNRQSAAYAREGVEIDTSTLADRVGACVVALDPIVQAIRAHVLRAERIHADDTTVPVLAKLKTVTGQLWTYVRDDQPFGGKESARGLLRIFADPRR